MKTDETSCRNIIFYNGFETVQVGVRIILKLLKHFALCNTVLYYHTVRATTNTGLVINVQTA